MTKVSKWTQRKICFSLGAPLLYTSSCIAKRVPLGLQRVHKHLFGAYQVLLRLLLLGFEISCYMQCSLYSQGHNTAAILCPCQIFQRY